jgi:type II secretory ATPase GspE/PulE/Tfp pilus assembly ATPase PilB-like protein
MSDLSAPYASFLPAPRPGPGLAWPTPPLPGYAAPAAARGAEACELIGTSGRVTPCELLRVDEAARQLLVHVPGAPGPTALRLDQLRALRWQEPLRPVAPVDAVDSVDSVDSVDALGHAPGNEMHQAARVPFSAQFKGGAELHGHTLGHAQTHWGWVLFEPLVDEPQAVRRLFVPHAVLEQMQVGKRLGETLIEEKMATPEQVQAALAEQALLRNRRLGELLVARDIVTRAELEAAIEQQAKMPMVRIGEALVGLQMITPAQLEAALQQQKRDRGTPLGELLVRQGVISREDLQTALSRKMGYPLVDVEQFPVEPDALACLPRALAERLPALPLMRRQGRLVLALEDPTRKAALQELEFATQHKLVPVLARSGALAAAVLRAYARQAAAPTPPTGPATTANTMAAQDARAVAEGPVASLPGPALHTPVAARNEPLTEVWQRLADEACSRQATHIHLDGQRVRLRIGGALQEANVTRHSAAPALLQSLLPIWPGPTVLTLRELGSTTLSSWRVWAWLAADGQAHAVLSRIETLEPAQHVQRQLPGPQRQAVQQALQGPPGLLVLAAAHAHGASALLHAVLALANSPRRSVHAVESSLNFHHAGVVQHACPPAVMAGQTAQATALQAALQADADVIGVGSEGAWLEPGLWPALRLALHAGRSVVWAVVAADAASALRSLCAAGAEGPELVRLLRGLAWRGEGAGAHHVDWLTPEAALAL